MKRRPEAQEAASLLGRPRALLPEPELVPQGLFYSCLVALGGLGALGCVLTAFQIPVQALILFGVGACCCLTFGLAAMNRKAWVIVSLAALVLWALWAWRQWENLEQGFAISANLVLQAYGDKLGISLPQLPNPIHPNRQAQIATLLWVGVEVPFFWLLTFLWARRKSTLSAFCLTGLFLLSHMAISLLPAAWALGALLLFWCVLLLTAGSLGQRHKLLDEQGTYRLAGTAAARPFTLLLLPLLALCMVGLYHLFPEDTYQRPQLITGLREDLSDGLGLEGPLPGDGGSGNSRVDLSALGSRHYTGETVLRVKYDWEGGPGPERRPKPGEGLSQELCGQRVHRPQLGASGQRRRPGAGGNHRGAGGPVPAGPVPGAGGQPEPLCQRHLLHPVCGEPWGASSRLAFLPYGPLGGDQWGEQGLALVEDGFAQSSRWLLGTDRYQLSCLGLPQGVSYYERAVSLPVDLYAAYCAAQGREVPENLTPEEDMAASLELSDALRGDPAAQPQAWTETGQFLPDRWRIPDWALSAYEAYDPEAAAFLQSVEAYSDFVYRYYTQLPAGLENFLDQFRLEHGLDPTGYSDPIAAMEEGLHRLYDQGYTYTLSPQSPPEGEDFVTWFLTEGREGYCVHFATAAVALFRSAGHPRPVRRGLRRALRLRRPVGGRARLQRPRLGGGLHRGHGLAAGGGDPRRAGSPRRLSQRPVPHSRGLSHPGARGLPPPRRPPRRPRPAPPPARRFRLRPALPPVTGRGAPGTSPGSRCWGCCWPWPGRRWPCGPTGPSAARRGGGPLPSGTGTRPPWPPTPICCGCGPWRSPAPPRPRSGSTWP